MNDSGYFNTASGSFHIGSRPSSRAWSDTTERPGSSLSSYPGAQRSIGQEIEHIKRLITRAESNKQQGAGSITAVVFRNRKQQPVAKEHIFQELDALRRRVKHEQQQLAEKAKQYELVRTPSQIDPGLESESEAESVLDERDEELEQANEALSVQRERFESLLENAEERVDLLTSQRDALHLEKVHLEELLQNGKTKVERSLQEERQKHQEETQKLEQELKQERNNREQILQSTEERLDRLTEEKEIAKARTSHLIEERDLLKTELKKLSTETGKLEADVARGKERLKGELGDTKAQLTRATKENSSLESELQATRSWVEELNAKIDESAEQLQEKSKAFDDLRTEKRSTDVAHKSAQEEILRLHSLKTEAEMSLKDATAKCSALERQNRDAAEQLEKMLAESAGSEKAFREQLAGLQSRCNDLAAEITESNEAKRDLEQRLSAVDSKHEVATKHAVELGLKHKEAERKITELMAAHAEELERARAEQAAQIKEVSDQHACEKAESMATYDKELQGIRAAHSKTLTELENKLSEAQRASDAASEQLTNEKERIRADHEEQKLTQAAETEEMRRRLEKSQKEREGLQAQLATLEHTAETLRQQIAEQHADHLEKVESLLAQHQERLDEARTTHEEEIAKLVTEQATALVQLREELENAELSRIEQSQASHAESLQEARLQADGEVAKMKELLELAQNEHEKDIAKMKSEHNAEVQRWIAKYEEAAESASTREKKELLAIQDSHTNEIARIRQEHEAALELKTKEIENERATALADHERSLQALSSRHTDELHRLREELAKVTASSKCDADAYEEMLASLRAEHSNDRNCLDSQHRERVESLEKIANDLRAELTRLEADHSAAQDASREDSVQAAAEMSAEHDRRISDLNDRHSEELHQFITQKNAEIEALHLQSNADKDKLRKEIESAQSRVADTHAAHEALLEDVKAKHSAELDAINDTLITKSTQLNKAIEAHEAKLADAQAEHVTTLESLRSEHVRQMDAAKNETRQAMQRDHDTALHNITQDFENRIEKLQNASTQSDLDRESSHQADLAEARLKGREELEQLRSEHSIASAAADSAQRETLRQMQVAHDQQLKILGEQHQQRLDDLRLTMSERQNQREKEFEASKRSAIEDAERIREDNARALENAKAEGGSTLEARLAEAAAKAQIEITAMRFEHDRALSEAQNELERLRHEHEKAIASVKSALEGELHATRTMHSQSVDELEAALKSKLEDAKTSHSKAISEHDSAWAEKLDELKREHAQSLTELLSNNDAATETKLRELDQIHADAISKAIRDARREAEERAAAAEEQHRLALESAVQRARSGSQAEVRNLKKRHQDAMAHIRQAAQKSSTVQLQELERTHRKDLEAAMTTAKEAAARDRHQLLLLQEEALKCETARIFEAQRSELTRLEESHRKNLAELEARMRMQKDTEESARKAAFDAEIEALQARLDATMTGQAEAERSLASLRQQLVSADKRVAEAKATSEQQVAALVTEKNDLTTQLEQVQSSLRELQRKQAEGAAAPRESVAIRQEAADLVSQISTLEEERTSMQLVLKKRQEEKNEVSRQNDFLVKELEMLLQQRSRSRDESSASSEALAKSPAFAVEPKGDKASFTPIKAARRNTNASRPTTPLSPGHRQAREDVEAFWKSRSFDDYLDNARAELSELGSVISANEALFARKIDEHVSELQRAKDELTADYDAKVAALAKDKDTMEQIITSEQHALFVKERKKLVAKYGVDFQDPTAQSAVLTSLPVDAAVALRTAEERLVDEYNQRITKRRSQIALKHAEEYQSITKDYDRRVSVLLNTRSRLEGDLSVDPSKFEAEYGSIASKSVRLVAERKSNIGAPRAAKYHGGLHDSPLRENLLVQSSPHLPLQELEVERARPRERPRTSNPRTEQSIPRSRSRPREFFPGSRDSPEATSQPMKARRGSNKHPPVPQRSLLRTKVAADFSAPAKSNVEIPAGPVVPRTPQDTPKSRVPSGFTQPQNGRSTDPEAEQAAYAHQRVVSLHEKSPSILRRIKDKVSSDNSRPSSQSGDESSSKRHLAGWRSLRQTRGKSRHLSSGLIYYNDPAKQPVPKTYQG